MPTINDVFEMLCKKAPISLAEDYDNSGFLVGRGSREVKKIIVSLDITSAVIDEAKREGAQLIVSHHPVIFNERKNVCDGDVTGDIVLSLIENNIGAICMHTNLDSAYGGVNDVLAGRLGLSDTVPVVQVGKDRREGLGRCGDLSEKKTLPEFLENICKTLCVNGVKYHDAGCPVFRVAVGGGACGEFVSLAPKLGFDTLVTADIKHNYFIEARELGINVIDAGHFATENVICPTLCDMLAEAFPTLSVAVAESNTDCTEFFTV